MKIIADKDNPILNRKEVKVIVEANKNPSFEEAAKLLTQQFKANEKAIAIKGVWGKFGRNTFLIQANIYKTEEDKNKTEPKSKKKKEEKKPVEAPAEKPTEKTKEEKPEE